MYGLCTDYVRGMYGIGGWEGGKDYFLLVFTYGKIILSAAINRKGIYIILVLTKIPKQAYLWMKKQEEIRKKAIDNFAKLSIVMVLKSRIQASNAPDSKSSTRPFSTLKINDKNESASQNKGLKLSAKKRSNIL